MTEWIGIAITTSEAAEEAAANMLVEAGAAGIQIEDATTGRPDGAVVSGFFAASQNPAELLPGLQARVAQLPAAGLALGAGTVTLSGIDQASWANQWKQYYHPLRVTRYLTIVPAWLDYTPAQAGELILRLDPEMAFGTGRHPTTALMLQLLETQLRGGETMIDVGTGSGVLALAARKLGAASVLATDVDAQAVANANANLALNDATGITVQANDLLTGIDVQVDLVVANILAEVLHPLIPQVPAVLKPHGRFLLSGIYHDQVAGIKQALAANGLTVVEEWRRGDWFALVAQHRAEVAA